MNSLDEITNQYLRSDLPQIQVGDKVEVISKNFSPNKKEGYRLTHFRGTVIAQKNRKQISYTFAVLKESNKIAIRSTFSYHSPLLVSIKKLGKINSKVRRAKLSYLERELNQKKDNE